MSSTTPIAIAPAGPTADDTWDGADPTTTAEAAGGGGVR